MIILSVAQEPKTQTDTTKGDTTIVIRKPLTDSIQIEQKVMKEELDKRIEKLKKK